MMAVETRLTGAEEPVPCEQRLHSPLSDIQVYADRCCNGIPTSPGEVRQSNTWGPRVDVATVELLGMGSPKVFSEKKRLVRLRRSVSRLGMRRSPRGQMERSCRRSKVAHQESNMGSAVRAKSPPLSEATPNNVRQNSICVTGAPRYHKGRKAAQTKRNGMSRLRDAVGAIFKHRGDHAADSTLADRYPLSNGQQRSPSVGLVNQHQEEDNGSRAPGPEHRGEHVNSTTSECNDRSCEPAATEDVREQFSPFVQSTTIHDMLASAIILPERCITPADIFPPTSASPPSISSTHIDDSTCVRRSKVIHPFSSSAPSLSLRRRSTAKGLQKRTKLIKKVDYLEDKLARAKQELEATESGYHSAEGKPFITSPMKGREQRPEASHPYANQCLRSPVTSCDTKREKKTATPSIRSRMSLRSREHPPLHDKDYHRDTTTYFGVNMLRESSPYGYSVTIGAGPAPQPSEGEVPVNETPRTSSRLKKHSNIAKRALSRFSTSLADRDDWPLPSIDKLSAHSSVNISRENEDVLSEQPEPSSPKEAVKPAPASPSAEISMPALSPSFNAFSFDLDNDTFGADRQKDSLGASVAPPDASGESEATVGMVYIARTSTNDNKRDENFKGLACDVSDDNANSMDAPMDPSQAAGTGR